MSRFLILLLVSAIIVSIIAQESTVAHNSQSALYTGAFQSGHWVEDTTAASRNPNAFHVQQRSQLSTSFIVALKHRDVEALKKELLAVSMPRSGSYGRHLSVSQIRAKYSPFGSDLEKVVTFFENIPGALVEVNQVGSMMQVKAPLQSIESHLKTKLQWFRHIDEATPKRSLRAVSPLDIPEDLQDIIAFV